MIMGRNGRYRALCQVRKNRRITPSGHRSNDTALTLRQKDNGRLPPPGKEPTCPARLCAHRGSPGRGELPPWGAPFLGCCLIAGDEPQVKVERLQRGEDVRPLGAMSACHDRGCEEGQGGVRELSRPARLDDLADPPGFPRRAWRRGAALVLPAHPRGPAAMARARRPLMPCGRCIFLWRRHPRRPGHASAQQTLAHLYLLYCGHLTVPAVRPARPGGSAYPGKPGAMRPSPGPGVLRDGPQVLAWGVSAGDLRSLSGGEPSSPEGPPVQRRHGSPWRARVAAGQSGCLSCSSAPDRPVKPGRNRRNRPAPPGLRGTGPGNPQDFSLR